MAIDRDRESGWMREPEAEENGSVLPASSTAIPPSSEEMSAAPASSPAHPGSRCNPLLLDFDGSVMPFLGGLGTFNKRLVLLTWIPALFLSFSQFSDFFLLDIPDKWCKTNGTMVMDTAHDSHLHLGNGTTTRAPEVMLLMPPPQLPTTQSPIAGTLPPNHNDSCLCHQWTYQIHAGLVQNVVSKRLLLRSYDQVSFFDKRLIVRRLQDRMLRKFGHRPTVVAIQRAWSDAKRRSPGALRRAVADISDTSDGRRAMVRLVKERRRRTAQLEYVPRETRPFQAVVTVHELPDSRPGHQQNWAISESSSSSDSPYDSPYRSEESQEASQEDVEEEGEASGAPSEAQFHADEDTTSASASASTSTSTLPTRQEPEGPVQTADEDTASASTSTSTLPTRQEPEGPVQTVETNQAGQLGELPPPFAHYATSRADAGYPQLTWLMAPIRYPQGQAQLRYNRALKKTRGIVELTIGLLKSRFMCLARPGGELLYSPLKASKIILACCVLHNMCVCRDDSWELTEEREPEVRQLPVPRQRNTTAGVAARNQLIAGYFTGN